MSKDKKMIPGSEKLTRPEEISALSKYLGHIKQVQEEHTHLGEDDLEVPGRTTGLIPKINELENHQEGLNVDENIELSKLIIGLDNKKKIVELDKTKIKGPERNNVSLGNSKLKLNAQQESKLDDTLVKGIVRDEVESLYDSAFSIIDSRNIELENKVIGGIEEKEPELEKSKLNIDVQEIDKLNNSRLDITDSRNINLENKIVKGIEEKNIKLEDKIVKGIEKKEPKLEKSKLSITDSRNIELENKVVGGVEEKEVGLRDTKLDIIDSRNISLENKVVGGVEEKEPELNNTLIKGNKSEDIGLDESLITGPTKTELPLDESEIKISEDENDLARYKDYLSLSNSDDLDKYNGILSMSENMGSYGSKLASLVSSYLSSESISVSRAQEFEQKLRELIELSGVWNIKQYNINKNVEDISNNSLNIPEDKNSEDSKAKKSELLGEDSSLNQSREKEIIFGFNKGGAKPGDYGWPVAMPETQLTSTAMIDKLNLNNYLRWSVEKLLGLWKPTSQAQRKTRQILLDETLALLVLAREQTEKLLKSNRSRLPGADLGIISDLLTSGVSGAAENLKNNLLNGLQSAFNGASGIDKLNPINRPKTDIFGTKDLTTGFELGNLRQSEGEVLGIGKTLGKILKSSILGNGWSSAKGASGGSYSFKDNYLSSAGIATTLFDLCGGESADIGNGSVEELYELLKTSPYITTPTKFGTIEEGRYGTMTLDSNAYWEVIFEPLCEESLNGGYSFLPAIREINLINYKEHGVYTRYGKWIPFVGFELSKSRLTSKTLGLYDGEISYPVSAELTNELRMTIVDDQYKSWKNYFQKCMDVSVYNSEPHYKSWYADSDSNLADIATRPTVVDKSQIVVSFYKNITFRIQIYSMTPQYSTIRRYDLLCVLREFSEEYSGEVDYGAADLNLSFSIVGENPIEIERPKELTSIPVDGKSLKNLAKKLNKRNNRSNSLIKLL